MTGVQASKKSYSLAQAAKSHCNNASWNFLVELHTKRFIFLWARIYSTKILASGINNFLILTQVHFPATKDWQV